MGSQNREDSPEERERELIERLRSQDPQAYRTLAEAHLKAVLNYAQRLLQNVAEAEDVTQETFLRLWQDPPAWQATASVKSWLFRVAHNQCMDRLRKRRPGASLEEEPAPASLGPGQVLDRRHTAEAVQRAIDALPLRQKSALLMQHYDGLSNPQIAEALGVGVEAVESLLGRARRSLRQALTPESTHS